MHRLKPPQIIILSFLITIVLGAVMLSLPQSSSDGVSIGAIDALFTATSATCVTGLIVKDTSIAFSRFGHTVIMFLIQLGGLGIMTFSTFFAILFGRKLTLRENVVVKGALDHHSVVGLKTLIIYILAITFGIEAIGAFCLYSRFGNVYSSIFHSISAFCNAGFSLNAASFVKYRQDAYVNLVMASLIVLGGIGFIVIIDIPKILKWFFRKIFLRSHEDIRHLFSRISLQTKLAVSISAILLLAGGIVFFLIENNRILYGYGLKGKMLMSFFQSVTARTAGFHTVSIQNLASPTLFFLIILMVIGASPGSTGGGIKTCTLGVMLAWAWAMIRNRPNIHIFKRNIPMPIFRKSVMIIGLAVAWIVVFTMLLSFVEDKNEAMPNYFLRILFEVTSAFGTVGLSTGITPILSSLGKALIILTMFAGRVGPLTLALALAAKENVTFYKYPDEKVIVG
ncbi:MAG: Trk family potassium uptake protein [Candidatus Omnitrophica bacterium]|nr:Trk family potassium uptake protein [Candidatus Omnitrophota bacterium]MBU4149855.1 Trk family potassium uptake protein [Candidatus Omnitrophota bacterium]